MGLVVYSFGFADGLCLFAGVRVVDTDGHAGDVARGLGDRSRVHIRHPQAAAHDHLGGWQSSDPDLSELAGSLFLRLWG